MTETDTLDMLHAAILADPSDDVARLAYADALEETGQDMDRARLIRVQMERADRIRRREPHWDMEQSRCRSMDCRVCALSHEAEWLLEKDSPLEPMRNWVRWTQDMFRAADGSGAPVFLLFDNGLPDDSWMPEGYACVRFARGFPGEVACTTRQWLDMAASILAHAPVRVVWLRQSLPDEVVCRTRWLPETGVFGQMLRIELAGPVHIHCDMLVFNIIATQNAVANMMAQLWPQIEFRRCTNTFASTDDPVPSAAGGLQNAPVHQHG